MSEDQIFQHEDTERKEGEAAEQAAVDDKERLSSELQEANEKYLRLYAEFENYKKSN
jgi:molecular chaperone GrpE